jgi:3',5'-cyclic AMP phosphodiesterase CpdA
MKRRRLNSIIMACLVMVLTMGATAHATTYVAWDDSEHDGNWLNNANWDTGYYPPNTSSYYARCQMTTGPVITAGQTIAAYRLYLDGATNGTLTMNGGSLTLTNHLYCAAVFADRATLNMNNGTLTIGANFYLGRDNGSIANVNLLGGTIDCASFYLESNGGTGAHINIEGSGKLIYTTLSGSNPISYYIQNGTIEAYDGLGAVIVDTTTMPGRTILTAFLSPKAGVPIPPAGTVDLPIDGTTLSWKPGSGSVSNDVYLGTSQNDVNDAQRLAGDIDGSGDVDFKDVSKLAEYWLLDPAGTEPYVGVNTDSIIDFLDYTLLAQDWKSLSAIFQRNQDANSFSCPSLAFDTNYYWRIDEVNGPATEKGNVWSFKTHSGRASLVVPLYGDTNVMSRAVLAWTAAPGAASHDVYFGTTNPPPFVGNQTATLYNPSGIDNSTTYYWRIDERYAGDVVRQGDLWTFRTMAAASEPDLVFVQATDPQMYWNNCNPNGIDNANWGVTIDKVNLINPDFMLVTGDLVNNLGDTTQGAGWQALAYLGYLDALSPTIPCYEVPGNHDSGEPPSASRYALWQTYFHDPLDDGVNPWYSFAYGNNFFIGLDTTVLASPFDGKDVLELTWLAQTLADANTVGYDHIFVFTHYGWTADKWVGTTALANKAQLSALFNQYHVDAVFAGHTHYDAYAVDGTVEWITTRSCTCNLGTPRPDPGIRIIKVYSDRFENEVRTLNSLPIGDANMIKGPYLTYPGNNAQMTVLWQVDTITNGCNIAWGTDTTYSLGNAYTSEYGTDHQHKYTITGLTPGTKYYYRVKVSGKEYTGSFTAAPASDATSVKFFMYGDTRTYIASNDSLCARMVSDYTSDAGYQTIVLHAGDWVENDNEATWTSQWFDPNYANYTNLKTASRNMAFMGCPGNHEVNGDTSGIRAVYRKYWPFPYPGSTLDYSFDYGPMHITCLDQTTVNGGGDPMTITAGQLTWLEADLAASSKPWKIIVLHHPGWTCGGGHTDNTQVQLQIQPLCLTYGVQMVVAGHNHYYSRAVVSGVQHITTGGGGASLYTPACTDPEIVTSSKSLDYCKVSISGDTLTCNVYSNTGTSLDSFTVTR